MNLKLKKDGVFLVVLAIIILIGFYYRMYFAFNIHYTNLHNGSEFGHDEYNYNRMAINLVEKGVYGYMTEGREPNAYVTPGYPLFLAGIYLICGKPSVLGVKIVQAVLSAISILLVFLIGKKLANRWVGIISAFFVALYPPLILYSRHLLTETLYIFFFLLYFLVALYAMQKEKWGWHFLAGFTAAAAILVRPLIFILLPLPYIFKYFFKKDIKAVSKQFGVYILGFIVLMTPWWIRNIITMDRFILLCTQSNPFYYGIIPDYQNLPVPKNEVVDGIKLIFNNLIHSPVQTIKWYTIGKINIIFGAQDYWLPEGMGNLTSLKLLHHWIIVTGAIGMAMSVFIKRLRFIAAYIVLNTGFQLMFIPTARYAVPLIPLIAICGAYMLWFLFSQCKSTTEPS